MVGNSMGKKLDNTHSPAKSFLLSIHCLVTLSANHNPITMNFKQQVKLTMAHSYIMALQVAKLVEEEMDIQLSEDAIAFIAVDIEKLKQL
jgi:transcriptional antiterminator